ncbi:uncharacterized protein LOC121880055 [Homarus americanus]|uniref:uncharacterized protein LOC121880055 n=1 Tax=Homarus americanus TaxID=6706 RepID=UPI001C48DB38|nr:uncharacterized protein LOC121880055 [Homarus americanus]
MDGDDDSSFIDDFLQEVFEPAEVSNLAQNKPFLCNKQNYNTLLDSTSPLKMTSSTPPLEIDNGRKNRSQNAENPKDKSNLKFISRENGCMEKFTSNDSFDFDDDFPFDNFEIEETNYKKSVITSTPPDSEFTQSSNIKMNNQAEISKEFKASNLVSNDTEKRIDFRSRILRTLKENKNLTSVSQYNSPSSISLQSVKSNLIESSPCLYENNKKRVSPELSNINKEVSDSSIKKPCKQIHRPDEIHPANIHSPRTTNNILGNNKKANFHLNASNQWKTCSLPQGNNPQSGHQQHSSISITPIKPPQVKVQKLSNPGGPVIQKRKFPGPAGILPQLGVNIAVPNIQQLHEKESPSSVVQDVVCSQDSADYFSQGPWQQMINDLDLDLTETVSPLKVFNIKWVLRTASLKGQAGVRKVPFLAVIVHNIDVKHTDATAILKDPTGEMNGTIASSVMDEYGPLLQPGSLLLLRGVTVLSPVGMRPATGLREHARRHYLNITLNTVLTIYTPDEFGHANITSIGRVDKRELCREAAAPKIAGGSRAIVEEEEEETLKDDSLQHRSLFSNVTSCHGRLDQSTSFVQIPNYRSPKFELNPNLQINLPQPQRSNQQYSPVNIPRFTGHASCSRPRLPSSVQNGKIMSPRIQSSVPHLQSNIQPSPIQPKVPVIYKGPTIRHPSLPISNAYDEGTNKTSNCNKFSSQDEEKEVNDLLEGVDTDSLFGDF